MARAAHPSYLEKSAQIVRQPEGSTVMASQGMGGALSLEMPLTKIVFYLIVISDISSLLVSI